MGASLFRIGASAATIAALIGLSACSSSPTASASSGPSLTATQPTATASAAPSSTVTSEAGIFTGRNASMTDIEALARLANPKTGETWFSTPKAIAAPSWAASNPNLDPSSISWFEFGMRAGNTIVGYVDQNIQELFERSKGGTWQWIGAPSARQPATGASGVSFGSAEVPLNETIYYDSLTLPAQFTLPSGEPLEVHENDRGGLASPGYTVANQPTGTTVDALGGYSIIRYATPVTFVWAGIYGVTAPSGVTYQDLYYMLHTPYGTYIPLFYDPFPGLDAVTWSVPTTFATDAFTYLADLNDISCGVWEKDHNTIVVGVPAAEWTVGGKTSLGQSVYVPTSSNRLLQPLYDSYAAAKSTAGQAALGLDAFRTAPAFVGYVIPGTSQWIAYLNGAYSGRAWC
jgi:hypothetical protein